MAFAQTAPLTITGPFQTFRFGYTGSFNSVTFTASGGTGPYTWSISSPIPALTFTTGGVLSGTPAAAASYARTVTVTDSLSATNSVDFTINIFDPLTFVSPPPNVQWTQGIPFSALLVVAGGSTGRGGAFFSLNSGTPPPGINLVFQPDRLEGIPTTPGTYVFQLSANNDADPTAFQTVTFLVNPPPTITTTSLPDGTQGLTYTQTLAGTGGTAPYLWGVVSGALPPGLTLNPPTGVITGKPTTNGTFNFAVALGDFLGAITAPRNLSIKINSLPPVFTTKSPLPRADIGVVYSQSLGPTSGIPPLTVTMIAGGLPPGLTLSPAGVVGGTATAVGNYNFTARVTDSIGIFADASYAIFAYGPPSITTASLPNGSVGVPYFAGISVKNGLQPVSLKLGGGTPPPGLHVDSAGAVTGTPTTVGSYGFSVIATDALANTGSAGYSITITQPLQILTSALAQGFVTVPYTQALSGSGGTLPYKWFVSSGSLPAGVNLNAQSGQFFGAPQASGTFNITITLNDAAGGSVPQSFVLTVDAGAGFTSSSPLPSAVAGSPYSFTFTAGGGTKPYKFNLDSGNLPAGLSLSPDGLLSGKPSEAGTFDFAVRVSDSGTAIAAASGAFAFSSGGLDAASSSAKSFRLVVAPGLQVSPLTLSFKGVAGGPVPPQQNLTALTVPPGIAVKVSVVDGGAWLSLQQLNTKAPVLTSVSVDPQSLNPGHYVGHILVVGLDTVPLNLTVTVTFDVDPAPPPSLSVDPGSLTFDGVQGGTPLSLTVSVLAAGATSKFSASASVDNGAGWLSVSGGGSASPAKPSSLTVTVDPSNLQPGTYTGSISLANNSGGSGAQVHVTLSVSVATRSLLVSQSGLTFLSVAGGKTAVGIRSFAVINGGKGVLNWSAAVAPAKQGDAAPKWLTISPPFGSTDAAKQPSIVDVQVDLSSLAAGEYYARIVVTSPEVSNAPQTISVVLNVAEGSLGPALSPAGLLFVAPAGGPDPAAQTFTITNLTQQPMTFVSSSRTGDSIWLAYSPSSGTIDARGSVDITAKATSGKLPAGVLFGSITLQFSDSSVLNVDTAFVLSAPPAPAAASKSHPAAEGCAATRLVPIFTSIATGFTVPSAWPTPLELKVVDDCGQFLGKGTVVSSFSNGDPSLPLTALRDGAWAGTWVPRGRSKTITVTGNSRNVDASLEGTAKATGGLAGNPGPPVAGSAAVYNAASLAPDLPVAAGSLVTIFGSKLAAGLVVADTLPLPTELADTQVLIAGVPAPLQFVSEGQINAIIPFDVPVNAKQQFVVRRGATITTPEAVAVAPAQPGIFTVDATGKGQGRLVDANFRVVDDSNPAKAGDTLTLFTTGLGDTSPSVPAGSAAPDNTPATTIVPATVTVGGVPASVLFSGLTPGLPGIYQIVLVLPSGVTPGGKVPVVVTTAGLASPPVTVAVQ